MCIAKDQMKRGGVSSWPLEQMVFREAHKNRTFY